MSVFEKIIYFISGTMAVPPIFGIWHIVSLVLVATLTVLACVYLKNAEEKLVKRILIVVYALIVVLEIMKQFIFAFSYSDGKVSWNYAWYMFPFQLCSSQLYILPFAIFLPDGKVKDACISYLMTFSFFGGFVVMLYPGDVFTYWIGINIQTMIHHGLQVIIGIFFAVRYKDKLNFKFFDFIY